MAPEDAIRAACALLNERRGAAALLVAIDGGGGAGKSTLARGISEEFAGFVSTVRCDDFYRPLDSSACSPAVAYEKYFDWRRLRDEALLPLRAGKTARYQRYDWSTDRLAEWIELEPREIVVLEGVFSMRPELRDLIDVAIFIETPRDERIHRMASRPQTDSSWMERWLAAEDWYFEQVAAHRSADLILEGF